MSTVYLAELQTRSFTFQALGATETAAVKALREGWDEHRRQYARSVLNPVVTWAEITADGVEVQIREMTVGGCLRDGETLTTPTTSRKRTR